MNLGLFWLYLTPSALRTDLHQKKLVVDSILTLRVWSFLSILSIVLKLTMLSSVLCLRSKCYKFGMYLSFRIYFGLKLHRVILSIRTVLLLLKSPTHQSYCSRPYPLNPTASCSPIRSWRTCQTGPDCNVASWSLWCPVAATTFPCCQLHSYCILPHCS